MIASTNWGKCEFCGLDIERGDSFVIIDGDFMHKGCACFSTVQHRGELTIKDIESVNRRIDKQTAYDYRQGTAPEEEAHQLTLSL
jgi:ribosomal protein L24